jgi:hypothetical protein
MAENNQRSITPSTPLQHGRGAIQPSGLGEIARASGETMATAQAAKQAALLQARFAIAIARPRDLDAVRDRLLKECLRPSFADAAIYHKPVGDGIEGPSIRFVEAALAALGNCWSDIDTVAETEESRTISVTVTDAEANVGHTASVTIHKTVERNSVRDGDEVLRQRTNSRGRTVYVKRATDDEILNTANALTSKALRTVGLRLIPGWLKDECMAACYATMENKAAVDPDAAKRKLLDAFASVGVSPEQVKTYLQHDGSKLTPKERTTLGGIYNAIRDGETTWAEVMDAKWNETLERGAASAAAAAAAGAAKAPAPSVKDKVVQAAQAVARRHPEAHPVEYPTPKAEPQPEAPPAKQATGREVAPLVCGKCGKAAPDLNSYGLCLDCESPEPGSAG